MNKMKRYAIVGGDDDTWGPRFGPVIADEMGSISSFDGEFFILLHLLEPLQEHGDKVEFLVVSPRYGGFTLDSIREKGCFVAIGRILPGKQIDLQKGLSKGDTDYFSIGVCTPVIGQSADC